MQKYILTPYKACHYCSVHYLQKQISTTTQRNSQEMILDDVAWRTKPT